MLWTKVHSTLPRHPKLLKLARCLRCNPPQAAGHLIFLWLWALEYAPDGDISQLTPAELSAVASVAGNPETFRASLIECGWLDEDGMIHNWEEYGGSYVVDREKERNRKREERRLKKEGKPLPGKPVRGTSGGHPVDVRGMSAPRGEESRGDKITDTHTPPREGADPSQSNKRPEASQGDLGINSGVLTPPGATKPPQKPKASESEVPTVETVIGTLAMAGIPEPFIRGHYEDWLLKDGQPNGRPIQAHKHIQTKWIYQQTQWRAGTHPFQEKTNASNRRNNRGSNDRNSWVAAQTVDNDHGKPFL